MPGWWRCTPTMAELSGRRGPTRAAIVPSCRSQCTGGAWWWDTCKTRWCLPTSRVAQSCIGSRSRPATTNTPRGRCTRSRSCCWRRRFAPAVCLRLEPGPDATVRCIPQWTSRSLANDVVSSVLYQGHIYGFDLHQPQASRHRPSRGTFRCLEWSTGKVRWSRDAIGQAALLAADGKLLLLTDAGSLVLARADASEYRELAHTAVRERGLLDAARALPGAPVRAQSYSGDLRLRRPAGRRARADRRRTAGADGTSTLPGWSAASGTIPTIRSRTRNWRCGLLRAWATSRRPC